MSTQTRSRAFTLPLDEWAANKKDRARSLLMSQTKLGKFLFALTDIAVFMFV